MNYTVCPVGEVRRPEQLKTRKESKASENIPLVIRNAWSIQMMVVLSACLMESEKNPDRKNLE